MKFGEVYLDKDEASFLQLGPNFLVLEEINMDKVKAEFLTALNKIRWEILGKEPDEIKCYKYRYSIEEQEKLDKIANGNRKQVDLKSKEINIRYKRCTKMK